MLAQYPYDSFIITIYTVQEIYKQIKLL